MASIPETDWAADVRRYVPDADAGIIAGIVRYCGIALRTRDASLVSFTDPAETARVRDGYCRKKLGLTEPDDVVDAAIAAVGERMKADNFKNRVTVYYLLAEHFGKLGLFGAGAAAAGVLPLMAAANERHREAGGGTTIGELAPLGLGALLFAGIAALIIANPRDRGTPAQQPEPVPAPATAPTTAPTTAPAIPTGAGIVAAEVEGRPQVSVYFDTAKSDLDAGFAAAVAPVKAYLDAHPDTHLRISGYNDPRGSAAVNAALSKARAFAVRDGLVKQGVPAARTDLVKPVDTTDAATSLEQARRVDIVVEDGPVPAAAAAPSETQAGGDAGLPPAK